MHPHFRGGLLNADHRITTLTSREFNRDASGAKSAAQTGRDACVLGCELLIAPDARTAWLPLSSSG
jgi:hypothetical protein